MSSQGDHRLARETAADWFVRLQSDDAAESDWAAFQAWLQADPSHGAAYEALEALWVEMDVGAAEIQARFLPTVVALGERRRAPRAIARRRLWAIGAAAAGIAVVVGLSAYRLAAPGPLQVYETRPGETRTVVLADGTRVQLNGASRIGVRLDRRGRHVEMADAQAVFDVAKDPARPFTIAAGDREVRVVGTQFDLLRHAGAVRVTVRRGVVEVRPLASGGDAPMRLTPGQQLVHQEGSASDLIRPVDAEAVLAWPSRRLVYRDEPLSQVAADVSRAFRRPISIDGSAASLRFSGVLQLDTEEAVIGRLEAFLPVKAERSADKVNLVLRPGSD